jgi:hypothetical protein
MSGKAVAGAKKRPRQRCGCPSKMRVITCNIRVITCHNTTLAWLLFAKKQVSGNAMANLELTIILDSGLRRNSG